MDEIAFILERMKELFQTDSSGHDYYHTLRVYHNALKIAESEACDKRIVALSSLLHDADDAKLFQTKDYANARHIMDECNVPTEIAEAVLRNISQVSFKGKDSTVPDTIEGRIVQDADRLDAMGAIGIARTFAFGGSRGRSMYDPGIPPHMDMTGDEYVHSEGTSINHFHEKLFLLKDLMNTDTGKMLAEERDSFLHAFMEEFMKEWEGI